MLKNMFITVERDDYSESVKELEYDFSIMRVDLSKDVTPAMVDMILTSLISYNDIGGKHIEFILSMLIKKMREKDITVLGGIHFQDDSKHIYNGCCCGMETWSEIVDELKEDKSPWMGHDPNVCCAKRNGIYYVADSELLNTGKKYSHTDENGNHFEYEPGVSIDEALQSENYMVISYEEEVFKKLLGKLDKDFNDFVQYPLKERLMQLTSEKMAEKFVEAFCVCFGREIVK